MRYRPLGQTGLQVSILGFGASPLGGVFGALREEDGVRAVHAAVDCGINFFDTSPYYGLTKSESVLGKALKTIPREKYLLATKVGRYGADAFDFSARRVTESVEESLRRLQTDVIDLLQCHDIEFGALDQIVEETLPALRRLRDQGKARFLGITGLPLALFPAVLDRTDMDAVLSYCHYTLNDSALEGLLPYLEAKQVGVINASPFAMGLLTESGPPAWHPASEALRAACARAAAHCRQRGADIARLALQFSTANPQIATTLAGMASEAQVRSNVAWLEAPSDTALLAETLALLEPVHNQTWPSGRPENSGGAAAR